MAEKGILRLGARCPRSHLANQDARECLVRLPALVNYLRRGEGLGRGGLPV